MNDSEIIAFVSRLPRPSNEQAEQAIARTRDVLLNEIAHMDDIATIDAPLLAIRRREQSSFLRRAMGVAACAILALGICWSYMASTSSVTFAQMIEAIQNERTVHYVIEENPDGEWSDTLEVWYSHSQGIHERRHDEKGDQLRIDNGSHLWVYQEGTDKAIVAQSIGAKGMIDTVMNIMSQGITFHRDSSKDRDIEGTRCRYHRACVVDAGELYEAWIDKEGRLRLFVASTKAEENWDERMRCCVDYDLPVDAKRFQPTFGNDVRIVDLSEAFGGLFPLEQALYRTTEHGFDVGLHELRTVSPNAFLAVLSMRPTRETRKQIPLEQPGGAYVQFRPVWPDDLRGRGIAQETIELSHFEADGISVHAYLFEHSSVGKPFVPDAATFTMEVLAHHLMKLPESPTVRFNVPMPATNDDVNDATGARLAKAIEELYLTALAVEQLPIDTVALCLAPRAPNEEELRERAALTRVKIEELRGQNFTMVPRVKPSETTLDRFLSEIKSQLRE